jgi:ABC-type oligopeptide transport system substrate-binding subunit
VPSGLPGFQENLCLDLCDHEPERARSFLQKVPPKQRTVTIDYTSGEPTEQVVAAVKKDLSSIGLTVKTKAHAFPSFLRLLQGGDQETYRLGWFAEYPTPDVFLDPLFRSDSADNHSGFSSPKVDSLLEQAHRAPSAGKREALYIQAEKLILREYPVVPIGSFISRWAVRPQVENIAFDVMGGFDAAEVDLVSR